MRKTNIDENFGSTNFSFVRMMRKLNKKENFKVEEINQMRKEYTDRFSLSGQEDAAEFYLYIMNKYIQSRTIMVLDDLPQFLKYMFPAIFDWYLTECRCNSGESTESFCHSVSTNVDKLSWK